MAALSSQRSREIGCVISRTERAMDWEGRNVFSLSAHGTQVLSRVTVPSTLAWLHLYACSQTPSMAALHDTAVHTRVMVFTGVEIFLFFKKKEKKGPLHTHTHTLLQIQVTQSESKSFESSAPPSVCVYFTDLSFYPLLCDRAARVSLSGDVFGKLESKIQRSGNRMHGKHRPRIESAHTRSSFGYFLDFISAR